MADFKAHLCWSFALRVGLVICSSIIDQSAFFDVPYTDLDYKVFTDAAKYVTQGESPYKRATYRYSPLIAFILTPNIWLDPIVGKIIFCLADILVGILIYQLLQLDGLTKKGATYYTLFWLYNPLSIVISTRGNSDSLSALLVLLTLYFHKKGNWVLCGLVHGASIHLRLYPIIFSLPMYLAIPSEGTNKVVKWFVPNFKRCKLVLSCIASLAALTYLFSTLYGPTFLDETLFYHLKRFDIRHNFSVYFYLQYLSFETPWMSYIKWFSLGPLVLLLTLLPFFYDSQPHLPFAQLCLSFVFVSFNSVLTCQYFIWYLVFVPLCLPYIWLKKGESFLIGNFWLVAQLAWLLPAYLLEFKGRNTFLYIWIQGLVFFWANVTVLSTLIRNYQRKVKVS